MCICVYVVVVVCLYKCAAVCTLTRQFLKDLLVFCCLIAGKHGGSSLISVVERWVDYTIRGYLMTRESEKDREVGRVMV